MLVTVKDRMSFEVCERRWALWIFCGARVVQCGWLGSWLCGKGGSALTDSRWLVAHKSTPTHHQHPPTECRYSIYLETCQIQSNNRQHTNPLCLSVHEITPPKKVTTPRTNIFLVQAQYVWFELVCCLCVVYVLSHNCFDMPIIPNQRVVWMCVCFRNPSRILWLVANLISKLKYTFSTLHY